MTIVETPNTLTHDRYRCNLRYQLRSNIQGVSGREVINYRAGRGLADKYFSHRNPCPEMYSNGDSAPGG